MKSWQLAVINILILFSLLTFSGCGGGGSSSSTSSPTSIKIAYIYDSKDSPACTTITSVLKGYSVTQIPHDTVTITTSSLSSYDLIIIADQNNPGVYDRSLANEIIKAGKPVIAMGKSGEKFYNTQDVVILKGLRSCHNGYGITQITPVTPNSIWTTPNVISDNPVTIFSDDDGHEYYAVVSPGWPQDFETETNGIPIAYYVDYPTAPRQYVLAREADKYFLWGLCGSIDDLNDTGKKLFANAVHYMLNN